MYKTYLPSLLQLKSLYRADIVEWASLSENSMTTFDQFNVNIFYKATHSFVTFLILFSVVTNRKSKQRYHQG